MPIPHRLTLLLICVGLSSNIQSGALPDRSFFDEDDSIGVTYYDASFGFQTPPSTLRLDGPNREKLAVETAPSLRGNDRAVLVWNSSPSGSWRVHIASPGWQILNLTGYSNLILHLNGPVGISAGALPVIGLETAANNLSKQIELGTYLETGLDEDPGTWQRVIIPLETFSAPGFSFNSVKDVFIQQSIADNQPHTLWLDDIRASVGTGDLPDQPIPTMPGGLVATPGDRSVMLNWQMDFQDIPAGFHVYRSPAGLNRFDRISTSRITTPGFGDPEVENGIDYDYRVTAVNLQEEESPPSEIITTTPEAFMDDTAFLDLLQKGAFHYFWYEANPSNGLVRDRSDFSSACSIAALGFGLSAFCVAEDRGWISRDQAVSRVLTTLETLLYLPQNESMDQSAGYKGWFYHFLDMETGLRARNSELSSIDTALLMAGVLHCSEFFHQDDPREASIRDLAMRLFNRIDWQWMTNRGQGLSLGWFPESGFLGISWRGYNEAMILYLMGMGAETDPLPSSTWEYWTSGYQWETFYNQSFLTFAPLFGHQYSHAWIDFRHTNDQWMAEKGSTYFINSRHATLVQREYAVKNKRRYVYYGELMWGFTACDGPGTLNTFGYIARGAPPNTNDDGTIAPTAVGGSIPFAPETCIPTLRHFYDAYRERIWTGYGFTDAFNLSVDWWGPDVIGIDQGAILLMIENHRNQGVWKRFMQNPVIRRGMEKAGFKNLKTVPLSIRKVTHPPLELSLSWRGMQGASYFTETSANLENWQLAPGGFIGNSDASNLDFPVLPADSSTDNSKFFRTYQIIP